MSLVVRFVDIYCRARTVYTDAFNYRVILSVVVSGKCGFLELANKSTLYNTMNLRFKLYIIYI